MAKRKFKNWEIKDLEKAVQRSARYQDMIKFPAWDDLKKMHLEKELSKFMKMASNIKNDKETRLRALSLIDCYNGILRYVDRVIENGKIASKGLADQ